MLHSHYLRNHDWYPETTYVGSVKTISSGMTASRYSYSVISFQRAIEHACVTWQFYGFVAFFCVCVLIKNIKRNVVIYIHELHYIFHKLDTQTTELTYLIMHHKNDSKLICLLLSFKDSLRRKGWDRMINIDIVKSFTISKSISRHSFFSCIMFILDLFPHSPNIICFSYIKFI